MSSYFKRLKEHPGVEIATMLTILGALAGATNKSAEWYVGGLFGLIIVGGFSWACVLISNIKSEPKKKEEKPYKFKPRPRQEVKKLALLHYIQTDEALYSIYNIEYLEGTKVSVWIERNSEPILQSQIFEESWGVMGGDSYSRFVTSCLNILRDYIKQQEEFIIKDEKVEQNMAIIKHDQQ